MPLGEWELRTDPAPVGRLLKRANSCLAFGDPGLPLAEAAGVVRDFYAARGRDALAQVELGVGRGLGPRRARLDAPCRAVTRTSW